MKGRQPAETAESSSATPKRITQARANVAAKRVEALAEPSRLRLLQYLEDQQDPMGLDEEWFGTKRGPEVKFGDSKAGMEKLAADVRALKNMVL